MATTTTPPGEPVRWYARAWSPSLGIGLHFTVPGKYQSWYAAREAAAVHASVMPSQVEVYRKALEPYAGVAAGVAE